MQKRGKKQKLLDPLGRSKSGKIAIKGVLKIDDFFDPLPEPTLPHFRSLQAPPKSVPELPKLIFGPIAYLVVSVNENAHFLHPPNHQKSIKIRIMQAKHELEKRKASEVDF